MSLAVTKNSPSRVDPSFFCVEMSLSRFDKNDGASQIRNPAVEEDSHKS